MQIAQIVPKVKTKGMGIFDYSIPPQLLPMIKIGLLVQVPFRGRKIEGVIIDMKRSSKIENLKPILTIIDPVPVINPTHIALSRWIADYYITDFSKALFGSIVPPAKRSIKKTANTENHNSEIATNKNNRKFLIVTDFEKRLKFYLKAIKKTLLLNKQIIILVPDLSIVNYFTNQIKEKVDIIHSGLTITERWNIWNSIRTGQSKIIIGSNSALFSPIKNLGLIVLDQEENETYKNDQAPRFNLPLVAEKLSELTGADLVIGSSAPSTQMYFRAHKNNFLYKIKSSNKPQISIVNMTYERGILSEPLKERISEALENHQKIIIVINRTGEGSRLVCTDCKWFYTCPTCKLPLSPKKEVAYCASCEKNYSLPISCPNCRGKNLKNVGLTTSRIEKIIKDYWPGIKTTRIEKGNDYLVKTEWDIAIVTSFALKLNLSAIKLVVILDADQNLNFPGFRMQEKNFQTYYKFLKMGDTGLIQTHLPESSLIKDLGNLDYESFYKKELANRQKFEFPPFVSLTKITYKNTDEAIGQKEAQIIFEKLEKMIQENKLAFTLLGPSAKTNAKKGLYGWQILIKQPSRNASIDSFLANLGKGWQIDVDPYDIA